MKKGVLILLAICLFVTATACGDVKNVQIVEGPSDIYTQEDIDASTVSIIEEEERPSDINTQEDIDASTVSIIEEEEGPSDIYTQEDIDAAIKVVLDYFERELPGCTMTEISYAGDEASERERDIKERYNADEVIVLISSFDVDASGGDGSLDPNCTYTGWKWILVREADGEWKHADHGYG